MVIMQWIVTFFSDYFHFQINETIDTITNIQSPAYTYLFLWIFIKIYRKIILNSKIYQNSIQFEDHELNVDFLTLSVHNSTDEKNIQRITSYLFNSFGFNCFLSEGNTKKLGRPLFYDITTKDTRIIGIEL